MGATLQVSQSVKKTLYNGGGKIELSDDGPSGGATDFRLNPGNWNENLLSRIIIAGGGGGSYCNAKINPSGGNAGGLKGKTDSTGTASYGTQTGCGGTSKNCGTLGEGFGGYFGSGGGGKYGGGGGNGNSGGGGGSGSIDWVYSLNNYEAITRESNHVGPGTARITFIHYHVCKSMYYCRCMFSYSISLYLFILCDSLNE